LSGNANAYPPVSSSLVLTPTLQSLDVAASKDPDVIAIYDTLSAYAYLRNEIHYTFDDTQLNQILANDPRGGTMKEGYLGVVRYITGKPDLKLADIGFLDYSQARWAFCREVKQLYEAALARGSIMPTPTMDPSMNPISIDIQGTDLDPRNRYIPPDLEAVPEIRALEQKAQFFAVYPTPRTEKMSPEPFRLLSVSVTGDLAHTQVDWQYGLVDDIFVKIEGKWRLVGEQTLKEHGG
jgi:hypothetical protein